MDNDSFDWISELYLSEKVDEDKLSDKLSFETDFLQDCFAFCNGDDSTDGDDGDADIEGESGTDSSISSTSLLAFAFPSFFFFFFFIFFAFSISSEINRAEV